MIDLMIAMNRDRVKKAFLKVRDELIAERNADGHWVGELSCSPLSTATAVTALAIADRVLNPNESRFRERIVKGLEWIVRNANRDGGWGDTDRSQSNLSTTVLCWSALTFAESTNMSAQKAIVKSEQWLKEKAGGINPEPISRAVMDRYGKDRTFSVPILTMAALTGRLGEGQNAWNHVLPLPFELAVLPPDFFAILRLPVVSYALPALIAMGIARHMHLPSQSSIWRKIRTRWKPRCLSILSTIQPQNGGFLEAIPLTSFVAMSLASSHLVGHPVTKKALDFIVQSVREDGSWPIDSNLSIWLSSLAMNALGKPGLEVLDDAEPLRLLDWLCAQQHQKRHPYTQAEPGGWAWTSLPGGVPDADDTAAALIALHSFWNGENHQKQIATKGSRWLCQLQNQDGGIPTFCRGWGALPFDRSSPDISAHAIIAWTKWMPHFSRKERHRARRSLKRALRYLIRVQRGDGTWCPLWFGNEAMPNDENPCYGTARIVMALSALSNALSSELSNHFKMQISSAIKNAIDWILLNQNEDGGWGGGYKTPSSIEETALATEAILSCISQKEIDKCIDLRWMVTASQKGLEWLILRVESGETNASPIGFYFARLWYYERLYPLIFTSSALRKAISIGDCFFDKTANPSTNSQDSF